MKKFLNISGIVALGAAIIFCVGVAVCAISPTAKNWVFDLIGIERNIDDELPSDEIPDVTPEDGADEGTNDNENGDSTTDDNTTGDNTSGDETDDDVIDVPTQGESSDENLENEEV